MAGGLAGGLTAYGLTGGELRGKDLAAMVWTGFGSGLAGSAGASTRAARAGANAGIPDLALTPDSALPEPVATPDQGLSPDPGPSARESAPSDHQPPWTHSATPEHVSATGQTDPPRAIRPEPWVGDGSTDRPVGMSPEMMAEGDQIFRDLFDNAHGSEREVLVAFMRGDAPGQPPDGNGGLRSPVIASDHPPGGPTPSPAQPSPGRGGAWPAWGNTSIARGSATVLAPAESGSVAVAAPIESGSVTTASRFSHAHAQQHQGGVGAITERTGMQPDSPALDSEIGTDGSSAHTDSFRIEYGFDGEMYLVAEETAGHADITTPRPLHETPDEGSTTVDDRAVGNLDFDAEFAKLEAQLAGSPYPASGDAAVPSVRTSDTTPAPLTATEDLGSHTNTESRSNSAATTDTQNVPQIDGAEVSGPNPKADSPVPGVAEPRNQTMSMNAPTAASETMRPTPFAGKPHMTSGTHLGSPTQPTEPASPQLTHSSTRDMTPPAPSVLPSTSAVTDADRSREPDATDPVGRMNPPRLAGDDLPPEPPEFVPPQAPYFPNVVPSYVPDPTTPVVPEYPMQTPEEYEVPQTDYMPIPGRSMPEPDVPPNVVPVVPHLPSDVPTDLPAMPPRDHPAVPIPDPSQNDSNTGVNPDAPPARELTLPIRHQAAPGTHLPATAPATPDNPVLPTRYATPPDSNTPGAPENPSSAPGPHPDDLAYIFDHSGLPQHSRPSPWALPPRPADPVESNRPVPRAQASLGDQPDGSGRRETRKLPSHAQNEAKSPQQNSPSPTTGDDSPSPTPTPTPTPTPWSHRQTPPLSVEASSPHTSPRNPAGKNAAFSNELDTSSASTENRPREPKPTPWHTSAPPEHHRSPTPASATQSVESHDTTAFAPVSAPLRVGDESSLQLRLSDDENIPPHDLRVGEQVAIAGGQVIIHRTRDGLLLRDLGSSTGTWVNHTKVGDRPVHLHPGDQIRSGPFVGSAQFSDDSHDSTPRSTEVRLNGPGGARSLALVRGGDPALLGPSGATLPTDRSLIDPETFGDYLALGAYPSGRVWVRGHGKKKLYVNDNVIESGTKFTLQPGDHVQIENAGYYFTVGFRPPEGGPFLDIIDATSESRSVQQDISWMPRHILERVFDDMSLGDDSAIVIGRTPLSRLPGMEHLVGENPEGPGERRWEEVPGAYLFLERQLYVDSGSAARFNSPSLVLHEFGHAVDWAYGIEGSPLSGLPEWRSLHEKWLDSIGEDADWDHYFDAPEEAFAQAFAEWVMDPRGLHRFVSSDEIAHEIRLYFNRLFQAAPAGNDPTLPPATSARETQDLRLGPVRQASSSEPGREPAARDARSENEIDERAALGLPQLRPRRQPLGHRRGIQGPDPFLGFHHDPDNGQEWGKPTPDESAGADPPPSTDRTATPVNRSENGDSVLVDPPSFVSGVLGAAEHDAAEIEAEMLLPHPEIDPDDLHGKNAAQIEQWLRDLDSRQQNRFDAVLRRGVFDAVARYVLADEGSGRGIREIIRRARELPPFVQAARRYENEVRTAMAVLAGPEVVRALGAGPVPGNEQIEWIGLVPNERVVVASPLRGQQRLLDEVRPGLRDWAAREGLQIEYWHVRIGENGRLTAEPTTGECAEPETQIRFYTNDDDIAWMRDLADQRSFAEKAEEAIASGERERQVLKGDATDPTMSEQVVLVTYNNGYRVIEKTVRSAEHGDAEELAALTYRAVGAWAAAVLRRTEFVLLMEYVPGAGADEAHPSYPGDAWEYVFRTPGAKRLGLGDKLVRPWDRHEHGSGNWRLMHHFKAVGIDHSNAFGQPHVFEGFAKHFKAIHRGEKHDYPRAKLMEIRQRILGLEPEYTRLNRTSWFEEVLAVFAMIEQHAADELEPMSTDLAETLDILERLRNSSGRGLVPYQPNPRTFQEWRADIAALRRSASGHIYVLRRLDILEGLVNLHLHAQLKQVSADQLDGTSPESVEKYLSDLSQWRALLEERWLGSTFRGRLRRFGKYLGGE
ncbi:FHA domain-containing protein [Nocardia asiatica]|uniref:FHA domain-containing protein n=1 Tax=Nocardia asiatica TaxID=209252 RepID=UPI002458A7CF|nr:FHA domain-containing protein [Nocardia asiatica]